jgi:hypothetical protein
MATHRRPARFRGSAAIAAVVITACTVASAVAAAPFAYLDGSWRTQLASLEIPVIIPQQLPPGFRLLHFKGKRYPTRVNGKSVTRATYDLDFENGAKRGITLFVTDEVDSPSSDPRDPARAPFSVTSAATGPLHIVPVKDPTGPMWISDTIRIDRPRGAHPTYLSLQGDADKASFEQLMASLVRFTH